MIPEGWVPTELDALASFSSGGTPSKQKQKFWGGEFPWISGKDLKSHYLENSIDTLTDEGFSIAKKAPKGASLILVRGMTLHKEFPVGYATREVAFNQDLKALIPSKGVNGLYLSYLLVGNATYIRQLVSVAGHGTGRIDTSSLKKFPVNKPPLAEQTKIASILSTWDKAIETAEKLIENRRSQKKALMQQLLTGEKRFSQFVSSRELTKNKCGEIPKDWQFVHVEQIAKQVSERNSDSRDYPVLSCTKYEGFVDSLKYFKKKVFSNDTSTYKVVARNTFAFPSNHIEEGSIGYQDIYDHGLVSPIYTVFKTNDKVHDGYLYKLLKTEHYRQIFAAQTNASVDRRGSLRWNEFKKIQVPLPSLSEQEAISNAIDAADKEMKNHQEQLENLQQQKKALMQQLLTGKRRVKVDKEAA